MEEERVKLMIKPEALISEGSLTGGGGCLQRWSVRLVVGFCGLSSVPCCGSAAAFILTASYPCLMPVGARKFHCCPPAR